MKSNTWLLNDADGYVCLSNLIEWIFFGEIAPSCLFFLLKENKEERRSARAHRTIYLRLGSKSAFEEEMHKQRFWGCFRGTDARWFCILNK